MRIDYSYGTTKKQNVIDMNVEEMLRVTILLIYYSNVRKCIVLMLHSETQYLSM